MSSFFRLFGAKILWVARGSRLGVGMLRWLTPPKTNVVKKKNLTLEHVNLRGSVRF